ncbi:MAG: hypothetical protein IPH37_16860 [Burkholderiales bacterium]|nr:hypothetical protein [Burkholderiales bacterium]
MTVVIVTHENDIADWAAQAGVSRRARRARPAPTGAQHAHGGGHMSAAGPSQGAMAPLGGQRSTHRDKRGGYFGMSFWAPFRLALRALAVNTLRSILTMLGIVIGVAAVITMIAVGGGAAGVCRSR